MRNLVRAVVAATVLAASLRPALASEPSDRDRVIHSVASAATGAGYLIIQLGFSRQLAPQACRWCEPPGLDSSIRDALKWQDTRRADVLSSISGYGLAPAALLGLTAFGSGLDADWRRRFDDVIPVIESGIVVGLLQHVSKFSAGRQRPDAHHVVAGTLTPTKEDNVSFFSGHTALAFGLAVSAGQVASLRGYAIAPAVWSIGLSLASTTGYLRIAADRHYFTDVVAGAATGAIVGYIWPRFVTRYLRRDSASIVPTPTGVAVLGTF